MRQLQDVQERMPRPRQHSETDAGSEGRQRGSAWADARRLVFYSFGILIAHRKFDTAIRQRINAQSHGALALEPALRPGAEAPLADVCPRPFHADGAAPGLDALTAAVAVACRA